VSIGAAAVAAFGLLACGEDGTAAGDHSRLQVVASFYPLAEAAERVGGDQVDVSNLTPAGSEPHDLELSPDQVDRIDEADLVVYLGAGFQPAVEDVVERADVRSLDLIDIVRLEAAGEQGSDEAEGLEGGLDPHFWLDPTRMVDAADAIEAALADASPDDAAAFATNADAYRDELTALDAEYADRLASCERHEIVTSHAAFHYLAERYGLEQLAISGVSPESEPDPERLAELSDLIDDHGVTTVFYETLVPPDLAETLAREAGVDTAVLDPIEGLSDDAIDNGASYVSVMEENLASLREALGCR